MLAFIAAAAIFIALGNLKKNQVCFKNNCFEVELAITPQEQAKGLMFRQELAPNKGMLFIFKQEGDYPFWMKNTKIPLDIIWIDKDKKVVFVGQNTPPCQSDPCNSIGPNKTAQYVLEINANTSQRLGIGVGDQASIEISLP